MRIKKKIDLCKNLTPSEIEIANFILENGPSLSSMTIQMLSDKLYLSKSAIHRFCKKLECKGYNELKIQVAKDLSEDMMENELIDVNNPFSNQDSPKEIAFKLRELYEVSIHDTFACIDEDELQYCSKLLNQCTVIDIYTHAHNSSIAENFQDKMLTIGRNVNCPKTFYTQRLTALSSNENHVAIILSYSGKASWILSIAKKLYENHTPIIVIGKIGNNHYPFYIKHHLGISDNENLRDRISQFSSHIALQYMMDILYSCIYNLKRKEHIAYFYNSIDYMDDRTID